MRDAMPPRGVPVWSAFVRIVILLLAALVAGRAANAQTATPAFVQANESTPTASSSTATVPFAIMQSPGDLNVVIVGWHDSNVDVQSIVDSNGNVYSLAVGPTVFPGVATQSIYYAPNIAATIANTVTVTFTAPAAWADVRVAEYSGIDRVAPLDAAAAGQGSNGLSDSSTLTTSSPTSLLVAANIVQSLVTEAGSGFTQRGATAPATDILEDRVVTQQGTYNATAPVTPGVPWVMQLVAFRAASTVDGEPPTAPGTLTATPISVSRIDLAWVASTDNVGVIAVALLE